MKSMDAEELKKTLDVNERMVREKIQQIRTKKRIIDGRIWQTTWLRKTDNFQI